VTHPVIEAAIRASVAVRPTRILGWSCLHCGHSWAGRAAAYQDEDIPKHHQRPKKCPRCFSRYWYQPRQRKARTE